MAVPGAIPIYRINPPEDNLATPKMGLVQREWNMTLQSSNIATEHVPFRSMTVPKLHLFSKKGDPSHV